MNLSTTDGIRNIWKMWYAYVQPFPPPNLSKILQLYEKDKLLRFTIIYTPALIILKTIKVHTFSSISFLLPLKLEESLPCKGHQPTKNFHPNHWHLTHHSVLSKQLAEVGLSMVIIYSQLIMHIIHSQEKNYQYKKATEAKIIIEKSTSKNMEFSLLISYVRFSESVSSWYWSFV